MSEKNESNEVVNDDEDKKYDRLIRKLAHQRLDQEERGDARRAPP